MTSPPIFRPPWWAPDPHAQTLWARLLRAKDIVPLQRERWDTPDDDFLDLDFVDLPDLREGLLVLILHGLEGSARSGYAYQLYLRLSMAGIPAVGLNFRSCSGELNRAPRLYHSGETGDVRWVIDRLRKRFPGRRLAAVGVSLGGNVLLKYLGETGESSGLDLAAAWSIPFDLATGADFMEHGFARVYVRRLLRSLKKKLVARADDLAPLIDFERGLSARTFREFDDAVTAPLHGFDGAVDYYARSSSAGFLKHIRTPTLVLHSRDDPFLPPEAVPVEALNANPAIDPLLTDHGGHVGFVAGPSPLDPVFRAERLIADWMKDRV